MIVPQAIPSITFGYGINYPQSVNFKGFQWDNNSNALYTQTPANQFNIFLNVFQLEVAGFLQNPSPDDYYNVVASHNDVCLLSENCIPFITDTGAYLVI